MDTDKRKVVEVWMMETSTGIVHEKVINTYTKGPLYCVYTDGNKVYKYPVRNIFRVIESYNPVSNDSK